MFSLSKVSLIVLSLTATSLTAPVPEPQDPSQLEKRDWSPPSDAFLKSLHQATSPIERYSLLSPGDFGFSFLDVPSFGGGGLDGDVVLADDTQWAGLVGTNIAMLMGFLGPCGMVAPHSHPRASEVYLNVAGPPLMAGIIPEDGTTAIIGYTGAGNATVLPKGSIHYLANTGCDPTVIVAGFNDENPGVLFVSTAYASFDTETYAAAFGGIGVEMLDPSKIPNTVILGRQDCLNKCGIDPTKFDLRNLTKSELLMQTYAKYLKANNFQM